VVTNPHKWFFAPVDVSLLLTRGCRSCATLQPGAGVLENGRSPGSDPRLQRVHAHAGPPVSGLKVWMLLRYFGLEGLRRRIAYHLELGGASPNGWWSRRTSSSWRRCRSPRSVSDTGRRLLRAARTTPTWRPSSTAEPRPHGGGESERRGLSVAHAVARPVHHQDGHGQPGGPTTRTWNESGRWCAVRRPAWASPGSDGARESRCRRVCEGVPGRCIGLSIAAVAVLLLLNPSGLGLSRNAATSPA